MEIYLDNCATTRVCPEAAEACLKAMTADYGNPSSLHRKGLEAEAILTDARKTVAKILSCPPESIYFTSNATESNNLSLLGAAAPPRRSFRRGGFPGSGGFGHLPRLLSDGQQRDRHRPPLRDPDPRPETEIPEAPDPHGRRPGLRQIPLEPEAAGSGLSLLQRPQATPPKASACSTSKKASA